MGRRLDDAKLTTLLEEEFEAALALYLKGSRPAVSSTIADVAQTLFLSKTQSFREALVGCFLAKIIDKGVDVRLPYANQGEDAFQGRAVDEDVVNPFFQQRQIPCSKGPYLAVFRRSIKFTPETRDGVRDKAGYDAFLVLLELLENASIKQSKTVLRFLLWKFIELREQGRIELARIQRLSLAQYERLLKELLEVPSGGLPSGSSFSRDVSDSQEMFQP